MKSSHYVGISFYQGQIQIAEIDHGKKPTLTALSERSTSLDFTHAAAFSPDHPQLHTFVYELEELFKQNRVHAKTVSFALPTDPVFINVIPVDAALQGNELTSYVQWEFRQYHPDVPAKDFIITAQSLPHGKKNVKQVFIVAVRKGMVGFLKRATTELRLQLHLIDVDQFSSEKALRVNYPELMKENTVLFGLRHGRIDASLLLQGEMVDYRAFPSDTPEALKKTVQSYLDYLKQKDGLESPGKIILHGIEITPQTVSSVQRETAIETEALDAVRHLTLSKKLYEPYVKESSRFAAAIGLALRTQ